MIINKNSGDDLAVAFQNILKKNIKKTASYVKDHEDHAKDHNDGDDCAKDDENDVKDHDNDGDCAKDHVHDSMCGGAYADDLTNDINDMIADSFAKDHEEHDAKDHEEHDAEDHMLHMSKDAADIMRGLGKIAGSLKSKGEVFAADVVEATALSIRNDFVKEAKQKSLVINELEKMAERLDKKGNKKAAIQVIKTASKIINS